MNAPREQRVAELLTRWRGGDEEALSALVPIVYHELRAIAHGLRWAERPNHTLQSTALVHEAYLRLVRQGPLEVENRAHFFALAARLMRQVLVDYARGYRALKRGAGCEIQLDYDLNIPGKAIVDVLPLDEALTTLSKFDPQQGKIVELRFFGGLTVEETSRVLEISPATVKRDWRQAKAWIARELKRDKDARRRSLEQN